MLLCPTIIGVFRRCLLSGSNERCLEIYNNPLSLPDDDRHGRYGNYNKSYFWVSFKNCNKSLWAGRPRADWIEIIPIFSFCINLALSLLNWVQDRSKCGTVSGTLQWSHNPFGCLFAVVVVTSLQGQSTVALDDGARFLQDSGARRQPLRAKKAPPPSTGPSSLSYRSVAGWLVARRGLSHC